MSEPEHAPTDGLAAVQSHFSRFAAAYPDLPLYAAICRHVAADAEAAEPLAHSAPGQARPVLWLAALHDLVLRRPDLPAARFYPSVVGRDWVDAGDPWPAVRQTVLEHRDELRATIASRTTQTNEVNRCVYLAVCLSLVSVDLVDHPVVLVEMGASAGLLLAVDRYRIEIHSAGGPLVLGDPRSPVHCGGRDDSPSSAAVMTVPPLPRLAGRAGIDLSPVALDDPDGIRWLEACLWPDVPGRVERFRAAVDLLRSDPPQVHRGDMIDDLAAVIDDTRRATGSPDAHVVVFSSWALTYVERDRRTDVAEVLTDVAADSTPVSWVTAEPPGCMPGLPLPDELADAGTVLGTRRWRGGTEIEPTVLGTSHPHGAWFALTNPLRS